MAGHLNVPYNLGQKTWALNSHCLGILLGSMHGGSGFGPHATNGGQAGGLTFDIAPVLYPIEG